MARRVTVTQDELLDEISLDLFGNPRQKGEFTIEEYLSKKGGSRDTVYRRLELLVKEGCYAKRKALVNNRERCVYRKLQNIGDAKHLPVKRQTNRAAMD
jgi:hypothetical protein